jgi:hypothetical protein
MVSSSELNSNPMSSSRKVIYDFGAHDGCDIPYYLLKADLVVCVEANPALCDQISNRFNQEISQGRLVIENCVLDTQHHSRDVPFYIHKEGNALSQFPQPDASVMDKFEQVLLPSKEVTDIIQCHGEPYYIKIDLEHYDQVILKHLFLNQVFPPYISAESHTIDIFCILVTLGGYEAFKLVDGSNVSVKYQNHGIQVGHESKAYPFPYGSAGPFGNDIDGDWMTKDNFSRLLLFAGLGWKDIHASNIDVPNQYYAPSPQFMIQIKIDY